MVHRKSMSVLLFLFALIVSSLGWSAPVTFNDTALLNAVKAQWEAATGLTLSTPPQDTELSNPLFTTLDARNLGITDLTGLQACTQLTDLNLGRNQITSLSPLSGLTQLIKLDVGFGVDLMSEKGPDFDPYETGTNLITDISPLAGLVNLQYLSVMGNSGLTSIGAVSTMNSLEQLWLSSNPLTDFSPLSGVSDTLQLLAIMNTGLHNLDIAIINGLTNLSALALIAESNLTDVSGLTAIRPTMIFALMMVPVSDISVVTNYTTLQQLTILGTNLTAIPDLSALTSLTQMEFIEGTISDISGLANMTGITDLSLTKNVLTDISALSTCIGLRKLDLSTNQLTDIQPLLDNAGIANMQWLDINDNAFSAGTPFCDENQLDQLKALAPGAGINSNALCGPAYNLTINITGTGSTSPYNPGVTPIEQNTQIFVNANPVAGSSYAFDHWEGDIGSSDPQSMNINVTMDANKTLTAVFVTPGDHTLTMSKTGAGSGFTSPEASGVYSYLEGRQTFVSAGPNPGSYFGGWSGSLTGYNLSQQLTMNGNKTVAANFVTSGFTLMVNTSGNGYVNFPTGQAFGLASGAVLDLVANAMPGYEFVEWQGDIGGGTPSNPTLQVTMNQNRTVTAVFNAVPTYTLTINVSGLGSGTTDPAPGAHTYAQGSSAGVHAIPNSNSAFDHWEGDIGSADPNNSYLYVTMDQHRTVTAVFVPANWSLNLQVTGNGTTNPAPGVYGYVDGAQASFSAQLLSGGEAFDQWTGDINPGSETNFWNGVMMDRNRTVTAHFVPGDWTLTLSTSGSGGTNPSPGSYAYLNGRTASLSAFSGPGGYFDGWTGSVTSDNTNINVVMDNNKALTAHFAGSGYTLTTNTVGNGYLNLWGTQYFAAGTEPVLTATPQGGWKFSEWTGDLPTGADVDNPVLPVLMDRNRSITAVFVQDIKTVTLIIEGPGSTDPAGSAAPGTQHSYISGQYVCINAVLGAGVAFDHWSGDIGGANSASSNICVNMDQNRTITAHFVAADWNLTIQTTGNGSTNPLPGTYGYRNGVNANVGFSLVSGGDAFSHWSGDIGGSSPQNMWMSLPMDRNRTITANFVPGNWTLTVSNASTPLGSISPEPGVYSYLNGQTADLNAQTNASAYFAGWTGDVSDDSPSLQVPMNSNKSIIANFTTSGYSLTLATEGQGWISGMGNNCFLASGREPVLHAVAQNGWKFDHWTGNIPAGESANNPNLPVLMNQNRALTAVFVEDFQVLTIILDGGGTTDPAGSPAPGTQHNYPRGQNVCINALAGAEAVFDYWSGDIGGANSTNPGLCLTMDQARTVTAHFSVPDWHLTIQTTGNGNTSPVPGTYGYANGAGANVQALLISGGDAFDNWSGDIGGNAPQSSSLNLTMDQDRSVTANFIPGDWTLTLAKAGEGGGTSPDPGTYSYLNGRTAELRANTNTSAFFAGWSGDVAGDNPIINVMMDDNKSVTATFASSGHILNVNADGQGWLNLSGTHYFASGTEPVLMATPWNGYQFDHWSGDLPAGADPNNQELPVLMDQNRSLTAHFVQPAQTLTIIIEGQGSTTPAGAALPGLQYAYAMGSTVWLSAAIGTNGWAFSGWSGDIGTANAQSMNIQVTMDQDRTVVATYVAADWVMTLGYTGNGSIYPESGNYGFMDGANVEAVANLINGGDAFNHWEGLPEDRNPNEAGHHFAIHGNLNLTAVFTPGDYTLTTTIADGGTAEYVSHPAGVYQYMAGRTAGLEVRPNSTTYWGGYSGDVNTFDYTCSLLMDANKNVAIHLGTSGYTLLVNQEGGGTTNPSGTTRYMPGAIPTVHAMDQGASLFDHWSGDLPVGVEPSNPDPEILMDQNRTLTANFVEADWYLYLQVQGNGSTNPSPGLYWYRADDIFTLTATPGANTLFLHWMGNIPEGQDPSALSISGTMTQNREIIAVFVPATVMVPDLSGKTRAEAEAALMSAGLVLGAVTQDYSSTVPAGQIISQNPAAEISVAYGSAVSIVISLGSCYTSIPNVAGLTKTEAQTALNTANLETGAVTYELSETVPEGQVISQNPVSGLVVECGTAIDLVVSGTGPEGGEEGEGETEGETGCHTADQDCNNLVNLSELLRVIQFFNSGGYHCQAGTEDGYAPGLGDTNCAPHASDYNTQNWLINLSELLRIIQFFNSGGYHYCPEQATEDGFCPGIA